MKKMFVLLCMVCSLCISGCSREKNENNVSTFHNEDYAFVDSYSIGDFEYNGSQVKKVECNWLIGSIEIVQAEKNICSVKENVKGLDEDYKLRWKLEDEVLKIQYCAPDFRGKLKGEGLKSLRLEIPSNIDLEVKNDVGSIILRDCTLQSGNFQIDVGDFNAYNLSASSLNTSIDVGAMDISLKSNKIGILETNVGSIHLYLLDNMGATINYSIGTGKFNDKDKKGNQVFGDGASMLSLRTDTGSIQVD
ncbi:MAG: hypothetical protein Q4C49_03495 [Bacillota bacterium]|nr:hypothetical protein [Bacillota bacterium]